MMEEAFLWAEMYSENYSMGVTTYGNKQKMTRGGFWCQILQPRDQCPKLSIEVIRPRH